MKHQQNESYEDFVYSQIGKRLLNDLTQWLQSSDLCRRSLSIVDWLMVMLLSLFVMFMVSYFVFPFEFGIHMGKVLEGIKTTFHGWK